MIKVLWFSNRGILNTNISGSGSWLYSMCNNLIRHYDVALYNITDSVEAKEIKETHRDNITEWVLPRGRLKNGLPSSKVISSIKSIVDTLKPDLIHIWGVENYWGLLFTRGYIVGYKTLLEMQGVLYACSYFYRNNLFWREFRAAQSFFKACYSFTYIYFQCSKFNHRLKYEKEIIEGFENISCQSLWTRSKVGVYNIKASLFSSIRPIRPQFVFSPKWDCDSKSESIITVASAEPYKGLHITLKAISLLKKDRPSIMLKVAGVSLEKANSGYLLFIKSLVHKLSLEENVCFLGSLNADRLIEQMKQSRCIVISSFVESYSAVFAESMYLGIPAVVSFSGAMTEFAKDKESALFFTPGDFVQCAYCISDLLTDNEQAKNISLNAMKLSCKNNEKSVADNQYRIYKQLIYDN